MPFLSRVGSVKFFKFGQFVFLSNNFKLLGVFIYRIFYDKDEIPIKNSQSQYITPQKRM